MVPRSRSASHRVESFDCSTIVVRRSSQVVANTLGLNDSKYQYVIDALEADEMRAEREKRDEEDRQKVTGSFLPTSMFVIVILLLFGVELEEHPSFSCKISMPRCCERSRAFMVRCELSRFLCSILHLC